MSQKLGYRGYCTHNPFGSYRMPVPMQNIIYGDYVRKNNLVFKLSVNEIFSPDCYLHLYSLLSELEDVEGVLMCSIYMLPKDSDMRRKIYDSFIKSGSELHFIIENLILRNEEDMEYIENLFSLIKMLDDCPQTDQLRSLEL